MTIEITVTASMNLYKTQLLNFSKSIFSVVTTILEKFDKPVIHEFWKMLIQNIHQIVTYLDYLSLN